MSNKQKKVTNSKSTGISRLLPWSLMIAGVIGLIASFALSVETVNYIRNPEASLSCSINPVVNCSSVIDTPQGEVFGFMNPLLGIAGFSMLIVFGLSLMYKPKYPLWVWRLAQAGFTLAALFVHWLIYSSIYVLGSLCPYCMTVWVVVIAAFLHITAYNLDKGLFGSNKALKSANEFVSTNHVLILVIWYTIIIGLIIQRFSISNLLA